MRRILKPLCSLVFASFITTSYSQETFEQSKCSLAKSHLVSKTTVADVAEDNYDVKYVKLNLTMTNASTHISGDVKTTAMVTAPTLSSYMFELDASHTIDSVLINGVNSTVTGGGPVRTVTVSPALSYGAMFTAHVYYHGTPTSGTLFSTLGINSLASPSWGNRATFTLSESYHAFEWWPCKQSLRDKIDSVDMWITVPDSLKAGSNGTLMAITTIDSVTHRFEWKERYPIDYYLVSAAVANYVDYSYYMHFTGSTDSMLVQNYVYSNPATLTNFHSVLDSTGMMIDYFSQLYGRYPFWHEKYGHCMGPLSGGMEHQTMTTCGFFEGTLVAHELGHQWFGDNATCGTWADIFMNEGFASYTESLFIDHFRSHAGMLANISGQQTNVKSLTGGSIYVDDTTSETRIFDSRLSYDKGACMLHMLRYVINNDSVFFQVYKTYQQQMTDSTGTIADFKHTAQAVAGMAPNGMNLDTFFNQWAYLQGYPIYTMSWNQSGADVMVQLDQTTSMPTSCALFTTPIDVRLHSATGDTIIRVFNNMASQVYSFTWDKTILTTSLDPNFWVLYKLNSVTHNPSLGAGVTTMPKLSITPNPASTEWIVDNIEIGAQVALNDVSGRKVWSTNASSARIVIPATQLSPGNYLLQVVNGDHRITQTLVKE